MLWWWRPCAAVLQDQSQGLDAAGDSATTESESVSDVQLLRSGGDERTLFRLTLQVCGGPTATAGNLLTAGAEECLCCCSAGHQRSQLRPTPTAAPEIHAPGHGAQVSDVAC